MILLCIYVKFVIINRTFSSCHFIISLYWYNTPFKFQCSTYTCIYSGPVRHFVWLSITENDRTTYPDLVKFLTEIRDWQTLAAHILPGSAAGPIDRIRATHNGNVRECKKALYMQFLEKGDRSWNTIMNALTRIGNDKLAKEIKKKLGLLYCVFYIIAYIMPIKVG